MRSENGVTETTPAISVLRCSAFSSSSMILAVFSLIPTSNTRRVRAAEALSVSAASPLIIANITALNPIVIKSTPRLKPKSLKKYVSDESMKNVTSSPTALRRTVGRYSTYSPTEISDNVEIIVSAIGTIGYA